MRLMFSTDLTLPLVTDKELVNHVQPFTVTANQVDTDDTQILRAESTVPQASSYRKTNFKG